MSGFSWQLLLWVSIGSGLGGAARYLVAGIIARWLGDGFPWGILLVNVLGSLLIGVLATATAPEGRWLLMPVERQFLMVGVLGGFTTFSTFSLQTLTLLQHGQLWPAGAYIAASVLLCLLGVAIGYWAGLMISR